MHDGDTYSINRLRTGTQSIETDVYLLIFELFLSICELFVNTHVFFGLVTL